MLFFRAFRRRVTLWQALARRFLATRRYRRQLRAAIAVQALYRGVSGRRRVRSLCSERLASLKPAIAAQWRDLHVALQYRSSLWRSLVHPTPVTVAVARMEVRSPGSVRRPLVCTQSRTAPPPAGGAGGDHRTARGQHQAEEREEAQEQRPRPLAGGGTRL